MNLMSSWAGLILPQSFWVACLLGAHNLLRRHCVAGDYCARLADIIRRSILSPEPPGHLNRQRRNGVIWEPECKGRRKQKCLVIIFFWLLISCSFVLRRILLLFNFDRLNLLFVVCGCRLSSLSLLPFPKPLSLSQSLSSALPLAAA